MNPLFLGLFIVAPTLAAVVTCILLFVNRKKIAKENAAREAATKAKLDATLPQKLVLDQKEPIRFSLTYGNPYITSTNTNGWSFANEPLIANPPTNPMDNASEKLAHDAAGYCTSHMERLGLARKLFRKRPLDPDERFHVPKPEQAIATILGDPKSEVAYYIPIRGAVPKVIDMADIDDFESSIFEIAAHPTVKAPKLLKDRDGCIFRISKAVFGAMKNEEDRNAFTLCNFAVKNFDQKLCKAPAVTRDAMLTAYAKVEEEGYKVSHVVIPINRLKDIRGVPDYEDEGKAEYMQTGVTGYLWGAEVYASNRQDSDMLLFVAAPLIGEVAHRKTGFSGTAMPDAEQLSEGAVISEEIGLVITNPRAISGLQIVEVERPMIAISTCSPNLLKLSDDIAGDPKFNALVEEVERRTKEDAGDTR